MRLSYQNQNINFNIAAYMAIIHNVLVAVLIFFLFQIRLHKRKSFALMNISKKFVDNFDFVS